MSVPVPMPCRLNCSTATSEGPHVAHAWPISYAAYLGLADKAPFSDENYETYNPKSRRLQDPNDRVDLEFRRLNRSL